MVCGLTVTFNPVDRLVIDHPSSSATCVQCGNSALFDNEFSQPSDFPQYFLFSLQKVSGILSQCESTCLMPCGFRQQGVTVRSGDEING